MGELTAKQLEILNKLSAHDRDAFMAETNRQYMKTFNLLNNSHSDDKSQKSTYNESTKRIVRKCMKLVHKNPSETFYALIDSDKRLNYIYTKEEFAKLYDLELLMEFRTVEEPLDWDEYMRSWLFDREELKFTFEENNMTSQFPHLRVLRLSLVCKFIRMMAVLKIMNERNAKCPQV